MPHQQELEKPELRKQPTQQPQRAQHKQSQQQQQQQRTQSQSSVYHHRTRMTIIAMFLTSHHTTLPSIHPDYPKLRRICEVMHKSIRLLYMMIQVEEVVVVVEYEATRRQDDDRVTINAMWIKLPMTMMTMMNDAIRRWSGYQNWGYFYL
jgi:hypothetical protein